MFFIGKIFPSATIAECEQEEQMYQAKKQPAQEPIEKEHVSNSGPATTLDELIINCVRNRPALWDGDSAKKFPAQTQQLWEEVCQEVGQPITKRDNIKAIWFDLRDKFRRARKNATKPMKSGAAAQKSKSSKFLFYNEMMRVYR